MRPIATSYYIIIYYTPRQHAIDCRRDINNKSIVLIEEKQSDGESQGNCFVRKMNRKPAPDFSTYDSTKEFDLTGHWHHPTCRHQMFNSLNELK